MVSALTCLSHPKWPFWICRNRLICQNQSHVPIVPCRSVSIEWPLSHKHTCIPVVFSTHLIWTQGAPNQSRLRSPKLGHRPDLHPLGKTWKEKVSCIRCFNILYFNMLVLFGWFGVFIVQATNLILIQWDDFKTQAIHIVLRNQQKNSVGQGLLYWSFGFLLTSSIYNIEVAKNWGLNTTLGYRLCEVWANLSGGSFLYFGLMIRGSPFLGHFLAFYYTSDTCSFAILLKDFVLKFFRSILIAFCSCFSCA